MEGAISIVTDCRTGRFWEAKYELLYAGTKVSQSLTGKLATASGSEASVCLPGGSGTQNCLTLEVQKSRSYSMTVHTFTQTSLRLGVGRLVD